MSTTYQQLEPVISALDDRIKTNLGAFPTDTAEGSIVSFPDGADDIPLKSLVVDINPVQDLHGYDSPWPAGGGVNTLDPESLIEQYSSSAFGLAITRSGEWITINGTYSGDSQTPQFRIMQKKDVSTFDDTYFAFPDSNSSNNITGWMSKADSNKTLTIGLRNMTQGTTYNIRFRIMGVTDTTRPTAYSPYSNICPISGWDGMTVNASGKNLLNPNYSAYQTNTGYSYMNGVVPEGQTARFTFIDKDTSVDLSGTSIGFQNGLDLNHSSPTVYNWVMQDGEIQSNVTNVKNGVTCSGVFIYPKTEAAFNAIFSRWDIMVELGSEATPYEPYNGQIIPIDWQTEAGTVYGGHLDVLSGVLTVDRAMVDLGDLSWNYVNGASGVKFFHSEAVTNAKRPSANAEATGAIFSTYATISAYDVYIGNIGGGIDTISNVRIHDPNYTDAAAFKAAMSGVQLCYELATPITIQLTPHDVKTLLGQNNIFADTGDSAVEYRADTKMYIERLTEPDADMIADANIVSGSYFMVGNTLYKATANIASGSAVIVGTNCTQKSLSEALNEINQ